MTTQVVRARALPFVCALVSLPLVCLPATALAVIRYHVDVIPAPFGGITHPAAINNLGQVVGYANDNSGGTQAFIYANHVTQAIPAIQGESAKYAVGINDSG